MRSLIVNNNQNLDTFLQKLIVFSLKIDPVKLIRFKFLSRERKSAIVWHPKAPPQKNIHFFTGT